MTDLSGKRYGEVLLVTPGEAGPQANVYNSFPLNDCPAELWSALDPQAIATENGAAAALLNGPRYWLMNSIEKEQQGPQIRKTFGGIEMILQATVLLSSMNPVLQRQQGHPAHGVRLQRRRRGLRTPGPPRPPVGDADLESGGGPQPHAGGPARSWPTGSTSPTDGPTGDRCSPRSCAWTPRRAPPKSPRTT